MMSFRLCTWPRPNPSAASCAMDTATSCGSFDRSSENANETSTSFWLLQSSQAAPIEPETTPMLSGEPPTNTALYGGCDGLVVTTCTLNAAKYCVTSAMICDLCVDVPEN